MQLGTNFCRTSDYWKVGENGRKKILGQSSANRESQTKAPHGYGNHVDEVLHA